MSAPSAMAAKPPPLKPNGTTSPVDCDDIDALDATLAALSLSNETLALSDGHGPDSGGDLTWMRPKVIPLTRTGLKPYVALDLVEFRLIGCSKGRKWITLLVEGACGMQGELRLGWNQAGRRIASKSSRGWQLHIVTPHPGAAAPHPANPARGSAASPELAGEPGAEGSAKRRRDDIFRKMFG